MNIHSDYDDESERTVLHYAVINNDLELAKLLIDAAEFDINAIDAPEGWTALHYAVAHGNNNAVKLLAENKADLNAKSYADETPLHVAVSKGELNTVKLLLEKGADINAKDKYGQKPLDVASDGNKKIILELMSQYQKNEMSQAELASRYGMLPVPSNDNSLRPPSNNNSEESYISNIFGKN